MRRGVRVAADDGETGKRPALLGADDVNDALADVVHAEEFDAELARIVLQSRDALGGIGIADALAAVRGRHIMIRDRERQFRPARLAAGFAQPLKRLGARHLMNQMPVDIDDARFARCLVDETAVPDLVV